ncbi:uncharacterized protein LOC101454469 [Ceratitis capitata]|uniref:(Mediterranean fruit fly) hypothetical protein n=1 Tax=Ceratitis capitata TaxID=7213 RepID=W8CDR8_CERCA|nr:uncharacterized protein LOC101454469 [Ceratitis capitata]CAD6993098.1 unnamed protein product [Ceratitis capitata]
MKSALLLAISAMLLVQFAHTLPTTRVAVVHNDNQILESNPKDVSSEEESPQAQLMIYTIAQIAKLSKWMLDTGSVVIRNTIKELKELPVRDELLQANITRMSNIVKENAELNLKEDEGAVLKLLVYMVDFATMMEDYENMPEDSKLKETLKTALQNNGYTKFENDFEQKVIEMANDFDTAFGEYVKVLTPAQRVEQAKLLVWYDEFKAETDGERKVDKFGEIFDIMS